VTHEETKSWWSKKAKNTLSTRAPSPLPNRVHAVPLFSAGCAESSRSMISLHIRHVVGDAGRDHVTPMNICKGSSTPENAGNAFDHSNRFTTLEKCRWVVDEWRKSVDDLNI
jgi:hypothetical protein